MRIVLLAALALSGCAHTRYLTRDCLTKQQLAEIERQAPPKVRDQLNGQADHDVKVLAANVLRLRAYQGLLTDTLRICSS